MSQGDATFCAEVKAELDTLDLGGEAIELAAKNLSSLWGRAVNDGNLSADARSRLKRKIGNLNSSLRTVTTTREEIRKIADGEVE